MVIKQNKKNKKSTSSTSLATKSGGTEETTGQTTSSTSSTSKTTSSRTVQSSSSESRNTSSKQSGQKSESLITSDVLDSSLPYTVTNPIEGGSTETKSKVHYIFGGTQISEVPSTPVLEERKRDSGRNKSNWDGSFTYEKSPVKTGKSTKSNTQIVETDPQSSFTSKVESHQSSSSSNVQKSSSTSYAVEIVDGKERIVDSKSREWGSSESKSQAEKFKAISGTGIETEVHYAAKQDEERKKFDTGDGKSKPMFEHSAIGSEKVIEQIGKNDPIEHVSETAQNLAYDPKTDKFVTMTGQVDNKSFLDSSITNRKNVIDSSITNRKNVIDSTSLQQVNKSASATSLVNPVQVVDSVTSSERFLTDARKTSNSSNTLTTENVEYFNSSTSSSSNVQKSSKITSSNVKDVTNKVITEERRTSVDDTASNNTFIVEEPYNSKNIASHRTDRNQSNWDGCFTYEGSKDNKNVIDKRKNVTDSTTTYTSKVYDNITNTWRIVDETTVNEKDIMIKDNNNVMSDRSKTVQGTSSNIGPGGGPGGPQRAQIAESTPRDGKRRPSSPSKRPQDTTNVTNVTNLSEIIDNKNTINRNQVSTTEILEDINSVKNLKSQNNTTKTVSSKYDTTNVSSTSKMDTKSSKLTQQIFDEKTKKWREVDEKTIKTKRPSLVRYVSRDDDGTVTTIFKRKVFDNRTRQWRLVDEKVYKDTKPYDSIPEMMDDVANVTTTTYTTKIYDTKTGTWRVVEQQQFVDRDTTVPTEIVREIEKDHPDVANITTTTEITKVSFSNKNSLTNCGMYRLSSVRVSQRINERF